MEAEEKQKRKEYGKLSQEEIEMVESKRRLMGALLKEGDLYNIAVLCDADYKRCNELKKFLKSHLFKLAVAKNDLDKNKVDIAKGSTEQKFRDGSNKNLKDLEAHNLQLENSIDEAIEAVRDLLVEISKHRDILRIDKKVYMSSEDYDAYVKKVITQTEKIGFSVFKERE